MPQLGQISPPATLLERQVGDALLQLTGLPPQILDLIGGGGTSRFTGKPAFAGLHELLGPDVIQALGNAFLAALLGNAVVTPQAVQNDPDLVFDREVPPRCTADILHHLLSRLLALEDLALIFVPLSLR